MAHSLYILDVSSLMFQVFHGIPEMTGRRGQPTNAVFGVTRDLFNILKQKKPTHVICALDASGPAARAEVYAEYKANRVEMPDNLRPQVQYILDVIEGFGLCNIGFPGWEADDVIATVAQQALSQDMDVYVVSNDKDIRQLLGPRMKIYHVRKDAYLGEDELLADWGVRPEQVIDFQSLVGDSVDNVPGIKGIGPKTATALLQQFGTLDEILARTAEVKAAKVREKLEQQAEQARMSRTLVTLRRDLPITVDWEQAKIGRYNVPKLLELFEDFNFRRFQDEARRLLPEEKEKKPRARKAPAKAKTLAFGDEEPTTSDIPDVGTAAVGAAAMGATAEPARPKRPLTYHIIDTSGKFARFLADLQQQPRFCLDLETTHIDAMRAEIVGWAISWQPHVGYYIAVRGPEGADVLNPCAVVEMLKPILENPAVEIINQNIKYDMLVLRQVGIRIAQIGLDPMVGDYLLDSGARTHNLDELAKRYLKHQMIPISDLIGKGLFERSMDQVEIPLVAEYAAEDAEVAWELAERIAPELRRQKLWDLYWNLERPLIEVLAELQYNGVAINSAVLKAQSQDAEGHLATIRQEIFQAAGREFNIDSPKQLQQILFTELKLPTRRRTSTGESSTNQDVLEELAHLHPLPAKMLEHRRLSKLKSTYLDALPAMVNPRTGRIHASFNQVVAATGRLSSSEPNLQNIPIRTPQGKRIREAFIAAERHQLLCADYSQIELRMLAHFSGDAALREAFAAGADIHTAVAAQIYDVPLDAVTSEQRSIAKAVNFGVIYGQSPYGLAMNLGIDKNTAAIFIEDYFAKYSGVDTYLQGVLEDCDVRGYAQTILGRKRAIAGIKTYGGRQRNVAERTAINTVIQGSAADLIKQAMLNVAARLRQEQSPAKMLLQIHDELVFEVPIDRVPETAALVRHEMESAMKLDVPLRVEVSSGGDWLNQSSIAV